METARGNTTIHGGASRDRLERTACGWRETEESVDYLTALIAIVLILQLIVLYSMRTVARRTDIRLPRIEGKLDQIQRHLGIAFEDKAGEMVRPLLLAGNKMKAIKEYRRITGVGLKDAKEAVDAMLLELEQQPQPDKG